MKHLFVFLGLAGLLFLTTSCHQATSSSSSTPAYENYLYMTDSNNGEVYYYNPTTLKASSTSFVSSGQNGSGEIYFYKGIGYICVAATGSGTPGVYHFDPSASSPVVEKVGISVSAEYIAFVSSTLAYVTVANYGKTDNGLYSFNPSSPSSGLTEVYSNADIYPQEVVVGPDSKIYFSDYGGTNMNESGHVYIYNPSDSTTSFSADLATGVTGLYSGTYNSTSGVFVADSGGVIYFIDESKTISTVTTAVTSPTRILQLANNNLFVGGWYNSYYITLSGVSATVSELKTSASSSFGSSDIAYKNNLIYLASGDYSDFTENKLFIYNEAGAKKSYSPLSVMAASGLYLSNIGFYQN